MNQPIHHSVDREGDVAEQFSAGRRAARVSMSMLLGLPVGIALVSVWANLVDTSPTVAEVDRIRGWSSVVRELPATVTFFGILAIGWAMAVRAVRRGAVRAGLRAMWWHAGALFLAMLIVLGGSAENVMTTRPATVKWLLLPLEVGITLGAVVLARRAAGQPSGRRHSIGSA